MKPPAEKHIALRQRKVYPSNELNDAVCFGQRIQKHFNPLRDNFFREKINIYIHFMLLLHINTTLVV